MSVASATLPDQQKQDRAQAQRSAATRHAERWTPIACQRIVALRRVYPLGRSIDDLSPRQAWQLRRRRRKALTAIEQLDEGLHVGSLMMLAFGGESRFSALARDDDELDANANLLKAADQRDRPLICVPEPAPVASFSLADRESAWRVRAGHCAGPPPPENSLALVDRCAGGRRSR